jgi:UDP-glucose 4-epimerase
MKDSRILIIGGNGFIGANLSKYLASRGFEVTSFDITKPELADPGVRYIQGDFFKDSELKNTIEKQDVIIHALSTVNPGNSNEVYMRGYEKDFIQSVKLFAWLAENGQKAVFISSGGTVYGEQEKQPIPETAAVHPVNHYGSVKLCIENAIRVFNTQAGGRTIIARPSNPYGPGQDYRKGVGFIDAAIKRALMGETIEIWGDGETIRDYIYIDDLCAMFQSLIESGEAYDVFNLSSGIGISQKDVLAILRSIGLDVRAEYLDSRSVDIEKIVLDNSRILSLGNNRLVDFRDGLTAYLHILQSEKAFQPGR